MIKKETIQRLLKDVKQLIRHPLTDNGIYYYQNGMVVKKQEPEPMSTPMMVLVFILYLALGVYAAKLSWYSNTKAGWSQGYKVLFSIFAFMFPITYITAHVLFKLDLLKKLKGGSMSY